jgi:replicative DNA helicase
MPQNLEAERALLGGMMLDNRRIADVIENLPAQVRRGLGAGASPASIRKSRSIEEPLFSDFANQEIFEVIVALFERDRGADLTTVAEELERRGRFQAVGGAAYLASLQEEMVSSIFIPEYTRIVVEKWRLRMLLRTAESIADDVLRADDDVDAIVNESERKIFEISQQTDSSDFIHVGSAAAASMVDIEARAKHSVQDVIGVPSGFVELDRMTTGFRPSNLIILAARPSVGKSAFAMNIASEVAVRHNRPVGIFSLEMSAHELTQRLLCTLSSIPLGKVRSNRLSRVDLDRLHAETERLNTAPLYIDDSSSLSVLDFRSRARRLKSKCPDLSLIIVDYLQLMHVSGTRMESRQQEVSTISRALKGLARELEIPVIALSQLSRASEQRGGRTTRDKMPKLSDLRESGAIEQDADMVIFVHRDFQARAEGEREIQPARPRHHPRRQAAQRSGRRPRTALPPRTHPVRQHPPRRPPARRLRRSLIPDRIFPHRRVVSACARAPARTGDAAPAALRDLLSESSSETRCPGETNVGLQPPRERSAQPICSAPSIKAAALPRRNPGSRCVPISRVFAQPSDGRS